MVDVIDLLNQYWGTIPYENKPTYGMFNAIFPVKENTVKLRLLEQSIPEYGIAKYDTEEEGITTLSFLATLTDLTTGKRLGAILEEKEGDNSEKKILGWQWYS